MCTTYTCSCLRGEIPPAVNRSAQTTTYLSISFYHLSFLYQNSTYFFLKRKTEIYDLNIWHWMFLYTCEIRRHGWNPLNEQCTVSSIMYERRYWIQNYSVWMYRGRTLLQQIHLTHVRATFVINESFLVALNLIRGWWDSRIKGKSRDLRGWTWNRRAGSLRFEGMEELYQ